MTEDELLLKITNRIPLYFQEGDDEYVILKAKMEVKVFDGKTLSKIIIVFVQNKSTGEVNEYDFSSLNINI